MLDKQDMHRERTPKTGESWPGQHPLEFSRVRASPKGPERSVLHPAYGRLARPLRSPADVQRNGSSVRRGNLPPSKKP